MEQASGAVTILRISYSHEQSQFIMQQRMIQTTATIAFPIGVHMAITHHVPNM